VKARELRFEEEPQTEVRFWGSPKRNSVPVNERKNLPEQVQQGVTHRNVSVQSRIASELVAPEEEPYATTAAREKAQRLRVDLQTVSGSGADGRITYKDVSRAAQG
jgi:pyruvate/2-oxoglutarate dehydrogenase complex dihydrolipoamide acyltransferase (E2) component